jgi:hypothetical protein
MRESTGKLYDYVGPVCGWQYVVTLIKLSL